MVSLFRRGLDRDGPAPQAPGDALLSSHILGRFLKRLRARPHPYLLDLGRLSGANIEFFAGLGCRVQVEDLLSPEPPAAPAPPVDTDGTAPADASAKPAPPVEAATPPSMGTTPTPGPRLRAGGPRPSRRIVLPPRTFPRHGLLDAPGGRRGVPAGRSPVGAARPETPSPAALPTRLAYDDETFDAIVAWDVFNYYSPASARAVAAEARRVLKPGGLIFCYFHARQAHAPDPLRRYQILDETRVNSDALPGRRMQRHLYQNRDIEKMFTGLRIAELYFLKNSVREILMEKKLPEPAPKPRPEPATPKPRFTLE